MPTPITRFLRHLIRNAAIMAALFLGVSATHLAATHLAFLWGGTLAGLAVYFFVAVAFVSVLTYLTE